MILIQLNNQNIYDFKKEISFFFLNNKDSYYFFHPHKLNWNTLKHIVKKSKKNFYSILLDENIICGYGILRGWDEMYEIPSLGIIIDKNYRGKGISIFLMNELHKIVKENGANKVRLTVLKENKPAISLYKKIGYDINELDENTLIGVKDV
jgi:ribosomal protein S18 acetylase RimI-like enzyme